MSELKLYRCLVGNRWNCSPAGLSREEFMEKIFYARQDFLSLRPNTLFCPKPDFTNRVVVKGQEDDVYSRKVMNQILGPGDPKNDHLIDVNFDNSVVIGEEEVEEVVMTRTKNPADGGIVTGAKNAVAFFNADCPIIALVEGEKLAVLHAGYRALMRPIRHEPNIIASALRHFDITNTRAYVGFGIGPCCWKPEYENKPEILDPSKIWLGNILQSALSTTTEKSPFGPGHVSVDLYALSRSMLMLAGIPENKILINSWRTCCAEQDGKPIFWSHTRFQAGLQEVDGRNMAIAFLSPNLQNDGFEKP